MAMAALGAVPPWLLALRHVTVVLHHVLSQPVPPPVECAGARPLGAPCMRLAAPLLPPYLPAPAQVAVLACAQYAPVLKFPLPPVGISEDSSFCGADVS